MSIRQIIAQKMVSGGDCIGSYEGKTVFIPYAIPGEKLEVEITDSKRDYDNSKIVKILEPSVHRVNPICPLYQTCGGCNMMHIDADFQTELRKELLKSSFARENIEVPEIKAVTGNSTGYRSRFQLHDGGLSMKHSNEIVKIDECPVATKEINEYLSSTPLEKRPKGRIHIFGGSCVVSENAAKVIIARQSEKQAEKETVIKNGKRKVKRVVNRYFSGTVLEPSNIATVLVNGKKISFDVQGFFQSNIEVLEKAVNLVCKGLSGKNVLDMYSGAGTFSVFLADKFEKVTMVEHNRDAMVFAEMNMAGKNHVSYGLSGAKWIKENAPSVISAQGVFDAVVIDPPRSGMEKEVCQWLCKTHPKYIRSVSCDAATHARDSAWLIKAGYRLTELYLLDFYPQTAHIESLACFEYQD
ncbi:MAG: TRAM domain-containing protein [Treponema sp.]|nr:TRAM domain-containing protein [Treponema sp.]